MTAPADADVREGRLRYYDALGGSGGPSTV